MNESELSKSKSQIKREMIELQKLGERLTQLNMEQLNKVGLPINLFNAVIEAKRISSHGAKRRQLQYIGRLMREIEDTTFIREYFQKLDMKDKRASALHHMLESWRERLISDDPSALTDFIENYPEADRQHLRQLITNSKKERISGKPRGSLKALFTYIRELHMRKEEESK